VKFQIEKRSVPNKNVGFNLLDIEPDRNSNYRFENENAARIIIASEFTFYYVDVE